MTPQEALKQVLDYDSDEVDEIDGIVEGVSAENLKVLYENPQVIERLSREDKEDLMEKIGDFLVSVKCEEISSDWITPSRVLSVAWKLFRDENFLKRLFTKIDMPDYNILEGLYEQSVETEEEVRLLINLINSFLKNTPILRLARIINKLEKKYPNMLSEDDTPAGNGKV